MGCHGLAVWPQTSHSTTLSLSFSIWRMGGWTDWSLRSLPLCLGRTAKAYTPLPLPLPLPPPLPSPFGFFASRVPSGSVDGARDLWMRLLGLLGPPDSSSHPGNAGNAALEGRLFCCWARQLLSEFIHLWATKAQHLKEKHFFGVPSPTRAQYTWTTLVLGSQLYLSSLTGVRLHLCLILGRCSCNDESVREPAHA